MARGKRAKPKLLELMKRMYVDEKKSLTEIHRATGIARGSIYYYLLRMGIEPRKVGTWWKELRDQNQERG